MMIFLLYFQQIQWFRSDYVHIHMKFCGFYKGDLISFSALSVQIITNLTTGPEQGKNLVRKASETQKGLPLSSIIFSRMSKNIPDVNYSLTTFLLKT